MLPLNGDRKPIPFLRTEFNESSGQFSPDGHWIAYTSDESGSDEIYVRNFSNGSAQGSWDTAGKWLISKRCIMSDSGLPDKYDATYKPRETC